MAIQKPFSLFAKNQLQLLILLMKENHRLVLLLFRVLENLSREFWIATTLKSPKNLFSLWGIFSPNLRILSRKNNEPTPFIHFFGHDFCQERYRVIYLVVQAAVIFVLLSTQALSPGPALPTSIQSPALFRSEQFLGLPEYHFPKHHFLKHHFPKYHFPGNFF